ncbi:hypothetical protein ACFYY5_29550 [Nocardia elegans]|uniref:Cell envelope biogenesis protein TolA n=1 Tax=Nocardia elegans TaxID=300029 RepID=A0ABW6TLI1_9NOCA
MPYFYEYQGDDQDLIVESDVPRPDLLEWAYWAQIDAPAKPAPSPKPAPEPEPAPETVETQPESEDQDDAPHPVKKAAPRKRAPRTAE